MANVTSDAAVTSPIESDMTRIESDITRASA
jgi:hypothetical protein